MVVLRMSVLEQHALYFSYDPLVVLGTSALEQHALYFSYNLLVVLGMSALEQHALCVSTCRKVLWHAHSTLSLPAVRTKPQNAL